MTKDASPRVEEFVVVTAAGAALVYGTVVALAANLPGLPTFSAVTLAWASVLLVAYVVFQRFAFEFEWRGHWLTANLDETVLFLGLLHLPGPAIVLLAPLAEAGMHAFSGRPRVKGVFNVAQLTLSAAAAWEIFVLFSFLGAPSIIAAALAIPVYVATSNLLVASIFARLEGERTLRVYRQRLAGTTIALSVVGMATGVIIQALFDLHPFAVIALLPFAFAIRRFTILSSRTDRELKAHRDMADVSTRLIATWNIDEIARLTLEACERALPTSRATLTIGSGDSARTWTTPDAAGAEPANKWAAELPGREGQTLGTLTIFPRPGQRSFDETDKALLRTLAGQTASAVLNAQAIDAIETAHQREIKNIERLAQQEKLSSLGMLITNVAHEIGNPLGFMRLSLAATKKSMERVAGHSDPLVRTEVTRALTGVATAQRGVDRVVDLSKSLRAVARRGEEGYRPTNLNEIARDVANVVRVGFEKNIRFEVDARDGPVWVNGNGGELTQIALNLAKNAAEAIGERGGVVRFVTTTQGGRARLAVEDDGPGIAPQALGRMFESFYTTKANGTGIGLNVSRSIAREHGGDLVCASQVGAGTTFTLDLPGLAAETTTDINSPFEQSAKSDLETRSPTST